MTTKGKAAVVVMDGFGLDPKLEWKIVERSRDALAPALWHQVLTAAGDPELATAALAPTSHGVARELARRSGRSWAELLPQVQQARARVVAALASAEPELRHALQASARSHHYAPWAVHTPYLFSLRQNHPTWLTRTAGVFTGHVDLNPEIMGNSDTGHQQIFNLCVARQIPAALSALIDTGEFFENEALNRDLCRVREGATVVFKTLLSGEFGDDGFVHSAWPHMEAFFQLYFERLGLPPERLQVEAVLDGRDSPYYSSLRTEEKEGIGRYGFLHKLRALLDRYGAARSLAWIIGRQFMDRDYKGALIRREYETVTANNGRRVADLDAALALVAADHAAGITDSQVEPIIVGEPIPVGDRTVFFNCIFRADRQEPITAALAGAVDFIRTQAEQKRRIESWEGFDWIRRPQGLRLWSMIDYHEALAKAGCLSVYRDSPHPHNLLHLLNQHVPGFSFLFLTEGVKEKHMGLFSRGRRSTPLTPAERRVIIPTCSKEQGVANDNDLYKVPQMRHPEIAAELTARLAAGDFDLIAANFPGPDMIGHLVENHFDSCLETLSSLDQELPAVIDAAGRQGWLLVLTSDHGNVEHYGPDHGNNDVLTTVILPPNRSDLRIEPPQGDSARLFDISWTLLEGLGISIDQLQVPPLPAGLADDARRLVGNPLVQTTRPRSPR